MLISIAIVARNEENYLENLLIDIMKQTVDLSNIELLLIDSMSEDSTFEIMQKFNRENKKYFFDVIVLKNNRISQSEGWNLAIDNFTGNALTRIDGHSKLDENFLINILKNLDSGEDVVGGPRLSIVEGDSKWIELLFTSEQSMFGSGIANYRKKTESNGYRKTMFHATYKREVLNKVGHFNVKLGRTEDNDFHYRIRKEGYKLFFDNRIISYQYIRPTIGKMMTQKYGNGFWIGKTLFIQPKCISIFHLIPGLFMMSLLLSLVITILFSNNFLILLVLGSYGIFCITAMLLQIIQRKNILLILLPMIFFILHASYGIGTIYGVLTGLKGAVKNFIRRKT